MPAIAKMIKKKVTQLFIDFITIHNKVLRIYIIVPLNKKKDNYKSTYTNIVAVDC